MNDKLHETVNANLNNYNSDIGSPSAGLSELSNKNRYFSIPDRITRGINNNEYNNNIFGNNKEENFFKSYKNSNLNNNQMDEIIKIIITIIIIKILIFQII